MFTNTSDTTLISYISFSAMMGLKWSMFSYCIYCLSAFFYVICFIGLTQHSMYAS